MSPNGTDPVRDAPLDLRDLERRYGSPACCRECDDVMALVAHVRALRAALRAVIPSEVARKVMAEYGDAGSLMNDVVTSYEHAAAVLASCTDGEAAPGT